MGSGTTREGEIQGMTTQERWMERIWSSTGGHLGRWRSRAVAIVEG